MSDEQPTILTADPRCPSTSCEGRPDRCGLYSHPPRCSTAEDCSVAGLPLIPADFLAWPPPAPLPPGEHKRRNESVGPIFGTGTPRVDVPGVSLPTPRVSPADLERWGEAQQRVAEWAAAPLPPGDDEPRATFDAIDRAEAAAMAEDLVVAIRREVVLVSLAQRLALALEDIYAEFSDQYEESEPFIAPLLSEAKRALPDPLSWAAAAPVLPPGVTLCRAADGTEFLVALGRDAVAVGYERRYDLDGDEPWYGPEVDATPGHCYVVRPPEPPAEPRTERVPAWDAVQRGLVCVTPDGRGMDTGRGDVLIVAKGESGGFLMYDDAGHAEANRPLIDQGGYVEAFVESDDA